MMEKLIIANWKLNPASLKEAKQLFSKVKRAKSKNAKVVICPPFVYLPLLKGVTLGAQTVSVEEKGAFTGEVSALQLKDLKVEYVIVGHSERRKYFGETNEIVAKKMQLVLSAGMTPILCIDNENQIPAGIPSNVIIAYEPSWAISNGDPYATKKLPTTQDVLQMNERIKNVLASQNVSDIRIIYGGSANAENAKQYLEVSDGLLVGGASLNAEEFTKIVKSVE